jgi:hypothetical protein
VQDCWRSANDRYRGAILFAVGLRLALVLAAVLLRPPAGSPAPAVTLWAWEWPQDLRFLAGRPGVAVAFLAATVKVGDGIETVRRRQPLRVPRDLPVTAVVRTEVSHRHPRLDGEARAAIIAAFVRAAALPGVRAVQSDFDAPVSLRADYRTLLTELRQALPRQVGLSMTALGSWCSGDDWLGLVAGQVDELVPMLFSMGPGGQEVWRQLAADGELRSPHCRSSVGVATYEVHPPLPRGRRLFLYHRGSWDAATFERVLARETP